MRKLLIATVLLILGTAGTAVADRRDHRGDHRDRVVNRDRGNDRSYNRGYNRGYNNNRGWNNRGNRPVVRDRYVRRPVYQNNGRYHFHGGRSVVYRRPIVNVRYTNYQYRPTLLVENYETVPGYTWVAGNWQWNGYEWNWINGHYAVDANYGYDDTSYYPTASNSYAPTSNGYQHDCD